MDLQTNIIMYTSKVPILSKKILPGDRRLTE